MKRDAEIKRVLVYRLGSLGDTIVALPSLHLVERAFPLAERRLLTNFPVAGKAAPAQAVLGDSGLVHGYFSYSVGMRQPLVVLMLILAIRRWKPEVLVYLTVARGIKAARRDALFFRLCGIRKIIGLPDTEDRQRNRVIDGSDLLEPEAARLARCIAELGNARLDDPASWDLRLSKEEKESAAIALQAAGGRPVIAVSLGTKVQAKDWGVENWHALLGCLVAVYPGHALALTGAGEERAVSLMAAEAWSAQMVAGPAINLCGKLTPRQSAAVYARSRIFLGHDSGPMHLASAVQTPCVAVFSSLNLPAVWFPYGPQHRVLYHRVDCMGCRLETCIIQQKKCILSISVDEVMHAVREVLEPETSGFG